MRLGGRAGGLRFALANGGVAPAGLVSLNQRQKRPISAVTDEEGGASKWIRGLSMRPDTTGIGSGCRR